MPEQMVSCYGCKHYTLCEKFVMTDKQGRPLPTNMFEERCDYDAARLYLLSWRDMLLSHRPYYSPGESRCIHVTDPTWPGHEDIQKTLMHQEAIEHHV